ncbi:MAG TPA: glycerophosphodiester phosphodiesterase family protein [Candidatus Nanopelagicaceae bacterium]|nr:glycerophosphodiester phosphodiesterase family protein [Candidatus Nanopelagicaceae bacterium]
MKKITLFIGHRGTLVDYDENTLEAFDIAIKSGANCIELDVRRTKDRKLIVFHDSILARTTNGIGLLKNLNYNDVKNLKTILRNQKIPLLEEFLDYMTDKTQFIIHMKDEGIEKEIFDLIDKKGVLNNCTISGRDFYKLNRYKNTFKPIKTCFNMTKGRGLNLKEFIEKARRKKLKIIPDMINLRSDLISNPFIKVCHINDIKSLAWGFMGYKQPLQVINSLIDNQIDGILFEDYHNLKIIRGN